MAFFTAKAPVNGDPGITAKHQGATFLFSSNSNRTAFKKNPKKYVPQFGEFCAYGTSVNALFPVDISTWQVRGDKLYLKLNPAILKTFNKDFTKNIAKAGKNRPKLSKKHSK